MKMSLFVLLILFSAYSAFGQECTAAFTVEDTDLTMQFTDASTTAPGDPIVSWFWDFDDGATSAQQNPVHTFEDVDKYDVVLEIETQSGCTSEVEIRVEVCVLNVSVNVGDCNAGGEIPLTVNVSDTYDNADEINISVDGNLVPGSPFDIQQDEPVTVNTSVLGDGQEHTVLVQSDDIGTCNEEFIFTVPDCSSDCFLSALNLQFAGGTTHTVNVGSGGNNTFTPSQTNLVIGDIVNFSFVDNGHTTTSDAGSGPDSWNSGELGAGAVYPVELTNPGVHPYYCIPHGGPGGSGMAGTLIADCPPSGNFTLNVNFTTTQATGGGYNVTLDGVLQPGSPFAYNGVGNQSAQISLPGDAAVHTVVITDVDDPSCDITRDITAPDCGAAPACSISLTAQQTGGCNASDNVSAEVTLNSINGSAGGFNLTADGSPVPGSPFSYTSGGTTVVTVELPGDGQNHTLTATDVNDSACTGSTQINTSDCTVTCNVSNLNVGGGTTATHVVFTEDFQFTPENITIAAGDIVEWQWTGDVAHTATSDAESGADSWDSGLLDNGAIYQSPVLAAGVHPYYCIPHGAPGGVGMAGTITVQTDCTDGMVSVNLTFNATGGGFDGYDVFADGAFVSNHAYAADGNNAVSVLVPGDGESHTLEIRDTDDPGCTISTSLTTPDCNAPTCQITAAAAENGGCNGDDTVPVDITVNDTGGGSGFSVSVDGNNAGSFTYSGTGTTVITVNVAGDGQSHEITVTDNDENTCSAATAVTTVNCVIPCELSNLTASAGGGAIQVVAVEDFEFVPADITISAGDIVEWQWTGDVAHTATSDAESGADSWDSGLLDNGAIYQSPVLAAGVHPYYCIPHGAPGGVGMAGTITVQTDCTDGMVSVNLTFNATGGGFDGYDVFADGAFVSNHAYAADGNNAVSVLVPGDGESHTLEIRDTDDPGCTISTSLTTPDCNAPTCQITAAAAENGGCNGDDTVPVDITVNDTGGGSGFSVSVDGNNAGSFTYSGTGTTVITVNVAGDGQSHEITVTDNDENTCSAVTAVTTVDCTVACEISDLALNIIGEGNPQTHTVLVEDFEFIPADLTVGAGDIIDFQWTGVIAHTTTSDVQDEAYSWNSGLLEQAAEFQINLTEEGIYPYYCEPHGAPGGVGMAGTITAEAAAPPCSDSGEVTVLLTFTAVGGGEAGFDVFLDEEFYQNYAYAVGAENSTEIILPGDGETHTFSVRDTENSACLLSQNFTVPDCTPDISCELEIADIQLTDCDENDEVQIQLLLNYTGQSEAGFNLFVDNNPHPDNPFAYTGDGTQTVTLNTAGTGNDAEITVTDAEFSDCIATEIIELPNCNPFCEISNFIVNTQPALHLTEVRDFDFFPQNLTVLPGDTIEFFWTGEIAHTTTSDALSGASSWDSPLLNTGATFQVILQEPGAHPYYCIPHGGPGGIGMAGVINVLAPCDGDNTAVSFSFDINAGSEAGYNVFLDGTFLDGPFAYQDNNGANTGIVQIPGDGEAHLLTIQDLETSFCAFTAQFSAPDCSAVCQISDLTAVFPDQLLHIVEVADFEFIPQDITVSAGDTIRYVWTGEIPHTVTSDAVSGASSFDSGLLEEGATFDLILEETGTHPYYCIPHGGPGGIGMAGSVTVNADGCTDGNVTAEMSFISTTGNPAGANVFTDGSITPESPLAQQAGVNNFTLLLPGDGALHTVVVADFSDPTCADTLQVMTENCNQTCGLMLTVTAAGDCNADNEIPYSFTLMSENAGTQFTVNTDDTTVENINYDPSGVTEFTLNLPGDGLPHLVTVTDADSITCTAQIELTPENCNPPCLLTGEVTQAGNCDAAGNVPFTLTLSAENPTGDNFLLFINEIPFPDNPVTYTGATTNVQFDLPGDGTIYQILVIDGENPDCSVQLTQTTPDCTGNCILSGFTATFFAPQVHTVEVEDFVFSPDDLTVNAGDTVRFVWTGEIPHTATSDATTGADVFNSGLLGQGSIFDFVPTQLGLHPYYCIPHGAPGGVGMAGNITVTDDCEDENLTVTFAFSATNVGVSGYNFYSDGDLLLSDEYAANNPTGLTLTLPATGQMLDISIRDQDDPTCRLDTLLTVPDCTDPCIDFAADFAFTTNPDDFTVSFSNQSAAAVTFAWTFGDGNSSSVADPVYTYTAEGDYEVCLTATDAEGCTDTHCEIVTVGEYLCEAVYEIENEGLTVFLTDNSVTTEPVTQWIWDFDDFSYSGGIGTAEHTYDELGTYEICMTIEAGVCEDDTCMVVDLTAPCLLFQANYVYVVDEEEYSVQFVDQTSGTPNQWLWGFADGTTSNLQNPAHIYAEPGVYNVCLLVQDTETGCNATHCEEVAVGPVSVSDPLRTSGDLLIYPNPTSARNPQWTISGIAGDDYNQTLTAELYDIRGRLVNRTELRGAESMLFSVEKSLASGVYFVVLRSPQGVYRGKVLTE